MLLLELAVGRQDINDYPQNSLLMNTNPADSQHHFEGNLPPWAAVAPKD